LGGVDMDKLRTLRARCGAARPLAALSSLLFAIPAIAGDLDRLKPLSGIVTDVQRAIDTRPNPNALPNALPPSQSKPAGSPDDALPGASLSPKLDPPGLEFKKSF
jgi:hypothetical protein